MMRNAETSDPDPGGRRLTARRRRIVEVIDDSVRRNGYAPSMREIGEAVGLASTSSVSYQLSVLEKTGYVSREARRPRTAALRASAPPAAGNRDWYVPTVPVTFALDACGIPVTADIRRTR